MLTEPKNFIANTDDYYIPSLHRDMHRDMLRNMLILQNDLNRSIDVNYLERLPPHKYLRAAMIEVIELYDHVGQYKWWKSTTIDMKQGQMEVVDIWHFILSELLILMKGNIKNTLDFMGFGAKVKSKEKEDHVFFDGKEYVLNSLDFKARLDLLTGLFASNRLNMSVFFSIAASLDLKFNDLYKF